MGKFLAHLGRGGLCTPGLRTAGGKASLQHFKVSGKEVKGKVAKGPAKGESPDRS